MSLSIPHLIGIGEILIMILNSLSNISTLDDRSFMVDGWCYLDNSHEHLYHGPNVFVSNEHCIIWELCCCLAIVVHRSTYLSKIFPFFQRSTWILQIANRGTSWNCNICNRFSCLSKTSNIWRDIANFFVFRAIAIQDVVKLNKFLRNHWQAFYPGIRQEHTDVSLEPWPIQCQHEICIDSQQGKKYRWFLHMIWLDRFTSRDQMVMWVSR